MPSRMNSCNKRPLKVSKSKEDVGLVAIAVSNPII
jgi:hypothetical protein